jgi:hypothetical protein
VEGYLDSVAGHAEVGVLDVDGDDLPGVGGADAEPLAGDHDDAVPGHLALDADRPGSWRGQRRAGDPRATEAGPLVGGNGGRQGLGEDAVADDVQEVPSRRSVTLLRANSAPILTLRPARSAIPSASTARSSSITVPAGRSARAGAGIAGGGPAGAAPRIRSSARSSGPRLDGTVLASR